MDICKQCTLFFPAKPCWTGIIHLLPASSSLSICLAGAESTFRLPWRQRTHALKRKENRRAVLHVPSSSSSVIRLKTFLLQGERSERQGQRPGVELFILRMKHHELGVEWGGWVMLFFLKKPKSCKVPTQQKRIL